MSSKNRSNSSMCTANVYRFLFILVCHQGISSYRGTPLIRSLIGQKKLALLTGARIKEGFLQENVRPFCQAANKKWPYYRGGGKAGFHCIIIRLYQRPAQVAGKHFIAHVILSCPKPLYQSLVSCERMDMIQV